MASVPLYRPLNSLELEIRLLTIEPARDHQAPIICHLSHARLSDNPTYDALSYVWGTPGEAPPPIAQNATHPFTLQENASAAIRRLRHGKKQRTIWIDAVCINQSDAIEKDTQLPFMRQIYEQANLVVIWLGEMTELAPLGVDDMQSRVGREYKFWNSTSGAFNQVAAELLGASGLIKNGTNSVAAMHAAILTNEVVLGEVREILARKWWTRVWIMQEAIVARRLKLMCGDQTFEWDGVGRAIDRMKGVTGSRGAIEVFGTIMNPEMLIEEDRTYQLISRFREMWARKRWNVSVLELMYEFRRLDCTNPRDRIFGFLGLVEAAVNYRIRPGAGASTADVYLQSARIILERSGSLDLLNCKREWKGVERATRPGDSLAYSILEKSKFHDVGATVSDGPDAPLRKGWARLPPGWERVRRVNPKSWSRFKEGLAGKGCYYWDHSTGTAHEESPLTRLPPPMAHHPVKQRILPPGWVKEWDNLGRSQVRYNMSGQQQQQGPAHAKTKSINLNSLPSWAPNWAAMTARDPEPLLDWSIEKPRYWAGGNTIPVLDTRQPSPRRIGTEGVLFDEIAQIGPPWHPPSPVPPVTRHDIPELQAWVDLALSSPYQVPPDGTGNPRKSALWRTLLTDYSGHLAAPASDWSMVELWHDTRNAEMGKGSWARQLPDLDTLATMGIMDHSKATVSITFLDSDMFTELLELDFSNAHVLSSAKHYGEIMRRIFGACRHRALFVTRGGYIGLGPWNARVGDRVVVLKGGKTPFLLRPMPFAGVNSHTLVGETYVYGIMGGEALSGIRGTGFGGEEGLATEMFYLV
ncbi:heterokaryon incompatibility protein-domain-containing protein [Rhypophila decipiens]|uniref:Heterokaryon incompatibility protein-domain-containing protein n=1 Tax=Rhypophila decipiens TaxID=261697 RepID=A0AAN6Y6T7_9PEZI|nr:heterokaryon incompatibility protein-domain-containing protein [Rhypophila decipiens]